MGCVVAFATQFQRKDIAQPVVWLFVLLVLSAKNKKARPVACAPTLPVSVVLPARLCCVRTVLSN